VVEFFSVTRPKALFVAAILLVAMALGATASAAQSSSRNAWCARYATKLPAHSLASPLLCPAARRAGEQRESELRSLDRQIAAAINKFRRAHGLVALRLVPGLNASARQHSDEMGADGYFDHPSADGTAFWKRIQHYYSSTGYTYWTVGENLLYATPNTTADVAMQQWIASPEHLANLKDKSWRDLGVSAVHVVDAGGVYGGSTVTIITTDFGARHK
jgi:uncharacterized protein YkwD